MLSLVRCPFLKIRNRESQFLLPPSRGNGQEGIPRQESIPIKESITIIINSCIRSRFLLKPIPSPKGIDSFKNIQKMAKEPELQSFWNRIRHSTSYHITYYSPSLQIGRSNIVVSGSPPPGVPVALLQEVLREECGPLLRHLDDLVLGGVESVLRLFAVVEDDHFLKDRKSSNSNVA